MGFHRTWLARSMLVLLLWLGSIVPAQAAVTITFWSQEMGKSFPHAFFTLYGTPDRGGAPIDESWGFTAKAISPAILWGSVGGKIDRTERKYIERSNAHFALTISDAQLDAVRRLVVEWGEKGNSSYNLNRRNCVHFVAEAMRRSGLTVVEEKKLMKKPRSFTQSIARLNTGRVALIEKPAPQYWATLPPLFPVAGAAVAR